ncbi:LysR family transcriptional regulator [Aquibium sp. ELW1220]|jgi:DNA-binding transcriptional LysR family regulator|uniref:LysR family transcriptional regulator n=1 Tax=Aquibium sp. ELW1220 TaxID=2976766 RepID=UPI0025B249AE|nr:LysR family transcriptional regulator [Aquibium sp. ELW1220]MDN2581048.1 LysR family transcriptional regulator [Aquibium sp. ELW1220]
MHAAVLRYFVAVARAGSIRKASEELHVASSAVSRQIQKIEDELGTPLFERLPSGLRLTRAGEIALRHARETLHQFDIMRGELGDLKGKKTGRVHIACLDSLSVQFLPERVMTFHRRHPAIDLRIRNDNYSQIFGFVADGDVDVGITFDLARPEDIRRVAGVPMPLMAMVARDHPLARSKSVTLQECAQFNLLLQLDNEVMSSMISIELAALDRTGRTLVATNNQMMLKPLILAGVGVAFFTPIGLLNELREGSVVALPIAGSRLQELEISVMVPRNRPLTGATQAFVDFIAAELVAYSKDIHEVLNR